MKKSNILLALSILISFSLSGIEIKSGFNDTIDIQRLYNGRAWKNTLYRIRGDQFIFTPEFIQGSVTIDNKKYNDIRLRYDIFNDELITINEKGVTIQLNKEMIDSFSIRFNDHNYYFARIDSDTTGPLKGFVNILYRGKTSLYVKYSKEILPLAAENRYDLFHQIIRTFVIKDGKAYRVYSKKGFLRLISDKKAEVNQFIKSNKVKLLKNEPGSFITVIEFYDKISQ